MRILAVQETDWIQRNPIQHHYILERLSQAGHDVRVIDYEIGWAARKGRVFERTREVEGVTKFFADARVRVIRPGMVRAPIVSRLSWLVGSVRETRRAIREFKPDVIVCFSLSNGLPALRMARRAGIPILFHELDALHTLAPRGTRWLARRFESALLKQANHILVTTRALRRYAIRLGAPEARVTISPPGADLRVFHADAPSAGVREGWGFRETDFVLFYMGFLYGFSGVFELAQALAKEGEKFPHVKLVVAGDGDDAARIREFVATHNLENRVKLLGRVPYAHLPRLLAASDACVLPSAANPIMNDIVPVKIYEYLAMGKPLISTKLPALVEEFNGDAFVIFSDTPRDFLAEAERLRADPDLCRELGKRARSAAEERFDREKIADEYAALLRRLSTGMNDSKPRLMAS